MTTAFWLLFGVAGMWLLGLAIVHGLRRPLERSGDAPYRFPSEIAGLSLLLGIGGTSWLLLLWSLAHGPLGAATSRGLAACGIGLGAIALWRGRAPVKVCIASARETLPRILKGGVAAVFTTVFLQAALTPQRLWDERAIFGIKALVLNQDASVHSDLLHHPDFAQYHPRYPLLLPLAEQHIYGLIGEADDRWAKLVPPLMGVGLVLVFAGVVSRHSDPSRGWLFALLLATIPSLTIWEYGLPSAQGDAPVACLHGVSVLYVWDWLRTRKIGRAGGGFSLLAAGIAGGLAVFTKDEGIAFFLVDAAILALLALCRAPSPAAADNRGGAFGHAVRGMLLYLGAAACVTAPWFWHRRGLPSTTEMTYFQRLSGAALLHGLSTLGWSIRHLASRMFREAFEWGLQWWGVLLGIVLAPLRSLRPAQLFLLLDVLGALAAIAAAGMLAPTPVEEHLGGSAHRFLIQLAPTAALFIAGQFIGDGVATGTRREVKNPAQGGST
jgi:hypothetical protein